MSKDPGDARGAVSAPSVAEPLLPAVLAEFEAIPSVEEVVTSLPQPARQIKATRTLGSRIRMVMVVIINCRLLNRCIFHTGY